MKIRIIFFLIISIFSACGNKEISQDQNQPNGVIEENRISFTHEQMASLSLVVDTVQLVRFGESFISSGKLELSPQGTVAASYAVSCFVKEIRVRVGDYVKKGQALAILEDEALISIQNEYLNSVQELEIKSKEYDRQKTLFQNQAGTEKMLEQAKSAFVSQNNTHKALTEKLNLLGIDPNALLHKGINRKIALPAKLDGYVNKVNVYTGQYVNAGTEMIQLLNIDEMYLNITVFEKDMAKIRIGTLVEAYTNMNPDQRIRGFIHQIQPGLNEDHSLSVFAKLEKVPVGWKPGMFMNAGVKATNNHEIAINEEAILTYKGSKWVVIPMGQNRFSLKSVGIGQTANGKTVIRSGLNSGDRVVVKGAYDVLLALNNEREE